MSYRGVYQSANQLISQSAGRVSAPWHVADVPRGRGKWKFGSLDAWKFGFLVVQLFRLSPACGRFGPLGLHALFSVLQGAKAPFPCRGVGQRPTSNRQSVNLPSSQSPLCSLCPFERFVIKTHRQSSCTFVVLRVLRVCPAGLTFHILPTLRPSRACRAFCSLFSVLCSLGWR